MPTATFIRRLDNDNNAPAEQTMWRLDPPIPGPHGPMAWVWVVASTLKDSHRVAADGRIEAGGEVLIFPSDPFTGEVSGDEIPGIGGYGFADPVAAFRGAGYRVVTEVMTVGTSPTAPTSRGERRSYLLFVAGQLNLRLPDDADVWISVQDGEVHALVQEFGDRARPTAETIAADPVVEWVKQPPTTPQYAHIHRWRAVYQGALCELSVVTTPTHLEGTPS
jgi:hypothetical protein